MRVLSLKYPSADNVLMRAGWQLSLKIFGVVLTLKVANAESVLLRASYLLNLKFSFQTRKCTDESFLVIHSGDGFNLKFPGEEHVLLRDGCGLNLKSS